MVSLAHHTALMMLGDWRVAISEHTYVYERK